MVALFFIRVLIFLAYKTKTFEICILESKLQLFGNFAIKQIYYHSKQFVEIPFGTEK